MVAGGVLLGANADVIGRDPHSCAHAKRRLERHELHRQAGALLRQFGGRKVGVVCQVVGQGCVNTCDCP